MKALLVFALSLPLFAQQVQPRVVGPSQITQVSGSGNVLATSKGAVTGGDCAKWDLLGNIVDSGAPCGSGTGSGLSLVTQNCSSTLALTWPSGGGDVLYDVTLSAACTITMGTPPAGQPQRMYLIIRPAGFQATLPASSGAIVWAGGSAPAPSTTISTAISFLSSGTAPIFGGI